MWPTGVESGSLKELLVIRLPDKLIFGVSVLIKFIKMAVLLVAASYFGVASYLIDINIPEYKLRLYEDDILVAIYPIAVGKSVTPSILGDFQIATIVKNPTWYPQGKDPVPPGEDNPLGPWWLGLNYPGYGIHGNNSPASIGKAQSKGCIRMHNEDVKYLAGKVQKGTPVRLRYEPLVAFFEDSLFKIAVFDDLYDLGINTPNNLRNIAAFYGYSLEAPNWVLNEYLKKSEGQAYSLPKAKDLRINGVLAGFGYEIAGDIALPLVALRHGNLNVSKEQAGYFIEASPINPVVGNKVAFSYLSDLDNSLWLKVTNETELSLEFYQSYFEGQSLGRVLYRGEYLFNATQIAKLLSISLFINSELNAAMLDGQLITAPRFYQGTLFLSEAELADYLALGVVWDTENYTATVGSIPVFLFGTEFNENGYIYKQKAYLPLSALEQLGFIPDWVDRILERVKIGESVMEANRARGNNFYLAVDDVTSVLGLEVKIESVGIIIGDDNCQDLNHTDLMEIAY